VVRVIKPGEAPIDAALYVCGERAEARRHLKQASELAQLTGSARERRRVRDLSALMDKQWVAGSNPAWVFQVIR
jgi:hypothetical protein